jgi:hypothetical protein
MHNIDRTTLETSFDEFAEESGFNLAPSQEFDMFGSNVRESPFSEAQEMELAAELLTLSNEAELDQFLGNLFRQASQAVGGFLRSPTGQALGNTLRGVARQALPALGTAAGTALGTKIGMPGLGGQVGGALANAAGQLFGLEIGGLQEQDQEFELARQFVRLAGSAASNAAIAAPNQDPRTTVRNALMTAAEQYAPGLLRRTPPSFNPSSSSPQTQPCTHQVSGQWVRKGNVIILKGA